ncbi:hypothetical protein [Polyangium fumosum]|uniref:Tox-GHH domain-containing protein n=1 Tax=Polyangium fumosum TaxID=889272 RepID=A0A4U1IL26_9BACT|nr:hypothetical protein [Polyangium fumosum]TKC94688.1 hypothetical protein E8A74_47940 [Polyangium fumosum]
MAWLPSIRPPGGALSLVLDSQITLVAALRLLAAFCVSVWLLGCGATPAHTQDWAQTTRSGQRVFRLCRRHPHVPPDARYWYDLGDGTLRTTRKPLEELLESRAVKVLFIYDPHAPPESRRLLGLAYQDLPCDKPPPPKPPPPEKIAAKEREGERKKDETRKDEQPKPKPIARSPERCPEPGQARRRGGTGARTCARTLVHTSERSRQASFPIARAPERCPEPGQARRRGGTGARTCARMLVHTSERSRQASFRRAEAPPAPRPVPPPAPKDPSEVNPGEVWQYETWSQTPEETALLERAQECLTGACHARHKNFQPKGGTKPAGRHNGPSLSTGSGSGGGASAPRPAPKTTVKTTTKPVPAKSNGGAAGQAGGKARLPPRGTPERRAIETARSKGVDAKQAQELADIRAGGRGSGVWTDQELAEIRQSGKFPEDVRWHHDPTVANRPDLAADPSVVRPVRGGTQGHLRAHGGDFRKP